MRYRKNNAKKKNSVFSNVPNRCLFIATVLTFRIGHTIVVVVGHPKLRRIFVRVVGTRIKRKKKQNKSQYLVYLPGHISIDYPGPIILS